jgi:selenocysteine lyase/cysteine desulfurase
LQTSSQNKGATQSMKMKTSEANEQAVKALFQIPDEITYLNCANMAPQLRAITEAGIEAVRARQSPWMISAQDWFSGAERLRSLAASVFGTDPDGVALIPAVSYGIAIAAANLPLEKGQTLALLDQEFPSNVYAWRELAERKGGKIIHVQRCGVSGWTEALEEAIDKYTAIVAVPQCHWTDGSRIDLVRVSDRARAVGARLVIDASQSLGAQELDLNRISPDFLVTVGYKWLLGPYGLGYLWAAPRWRTTGIPLEYSWLTRAGSEQFSRLTEYTREYRPAARRFDMGEFPQFILAPMAISALEQILQWRVKEIAASLTPLTDRIAELAVENGYSVLPREQRCTHMIGIRNASGIPSGLAALLGQEKIFVSIRGDSIRVAPHLYNDLNDIDRLFDVLRKLNRTNQPAAGRT